jgi:transposase
MARGCGCALGVCTRDVLFGPRRQRFGQKSEAFIDPAQLSLFEEDNGADIDAALALAEQVQGSLKPQAPAPRKSAGRAALPAHLPRVDVRHEPDSLQCSGCQGALSKVSDNITEQLQVQPAKFWVERHIRPQYSCRCCQTMHAAPVAPAVIDGSLAGTSTLAWVITQKYLVPH